jgi:hypothetical protein
MGERLDRRVWEDEGQSRVPNVGPPFTTQQVDDEVLEEKLRLDEASREEPPVVERVIDSEGGGPAPTSVVDRVNP